MKSPIEKIGEIDLDTLLKEIGHIKLPKEGARQFPFQKRKNDNDGESAKGNDYTFRVDDLEYDTLIYDEYNYTNLIIEKYNMCRTRIMWMKQKFAYGWHKDHSPRIHIPLVTNEHNMFIIDDNVYRIPADGGVYLVNTTLPHTFVNANSEPFLRSHLLGTSKVQYK